MSHLPQPVRSAITVAQALYDEPRDLAPHEREFLTAVHRITMQCARTKGEAVRAWGDGSRAYEAVAYLANSKQDDHLARALQSYDAVEAALDDEIDEVDTDFSQRAAE